MAEGGTNFPGRQVGFLTSMYLAPFLSDRIATPPGRDGPRSCGPRRDRPRIGCPGIDLTDMVLHHWPCGQFEKLEGVLKFRRR